MTTKTDRSVKALEITKEIYPQVKNYYQCLWQAERDKSKFICWIHATDVIELLQAMDIIPVVPENFCATCAAKQITPTLCQIAEDDGYSHDLCSYFRTTYGFIKEGKNLSHLPFPGGGMPKPDFMISTDNACTTYSKWWRVMERYYQVPAFILDWPHMPQRAKGSPQGNHYLEYQITQLKSCISFLEEQTEKKMDQDRLKEAVAYSAQAVEHFKTAQEYRKAIPCPLGGEDILSNMAVLVLLSGTPEAADYYRKLALEVEERVKNKVGVVPNERHRLLFDNLPPWYSLGFFNYFQQFGAISVFEDYLWNFYPALEQLDPSQPLVALAKKLTGAVLLRMPFKERVDVTLKAAKDYQVDGAILCVNRNCKDYSSASWVLKDKLQQELGIPSLILEMDQADPRDYADAPVKARIDAFMEMLDRSKS